MARYMIEAKHNPEDCLRNLDEVLAKGPEYLAKVDFGCPVEHTTWVVVDAPSETAARNQVPAFVRSTARVVGVSKMTPEQIKALHGG